MKTNKDISYTAYTGHTIKIPKGTEVVPAHNLPKDNESGIAYWALEWPHMSEYAMGHMRTYGYGITEEDVIK